MKKMKRYLKTYIENMIILFQIALIMLFSTETTDLKLFIISKIIIVSVIIINHMILKRYSKLYN